MSERRRSGLAGMSGMFGLLGRKPSDQSARRRSSQAAPPVFTDAMERLQRGPRDVARLMNDAPLFAELEPAEREVLAEIVQIARCHGGTQIWQAGDPAVYAMVMLQGRVELRRRIGPGVEHAVRVMAAGDIVGLEAALGASAYHLGAFATERTAVLRIPRAELQQVLAVGKPSAVKLYVALSLRLGDQLREATQEVVRLLERASVMPKSGSTSGDDMLGSLLKGTT